MNIEKHDIVKYSIMGAGGAALYVSAIASFMFYAPKFLKSLPTEDTVLMPIIMLMLLVFSVALMGVLIFGRPVVWYLDGKRKEAIHLLGYTLLVFFIVIVAIFSVLYLNV